MITRQRDTDRLVTEYLDDESLLNLCRAAPGLAIYQDDTFWRDRLLSKYKPIDKLTDKTWKTLYLQIIYYKDKSDLQTERIILSSQGGHGDVAECFICQDENPYYEWGMYGASVGGH